MMQYMRENTKVVLWIVVIAFLVTIFAVWGLDLQTGGSGGDPAILGRVNGVAITRSDYQFIYEQFAQQMRANSQNQPLTFAQQRFVEEQAWENLVYGIITDQEIEKLGIRVSNDEIVSFLRNSPPAEIQQYFPDENNQFDEAAYQAALSNPEIDWTNLELLARQRIPRLKLNEYLSSQVHVSEAEVQRAYESEAIELAIEYVTFAIDAADIASYTPSDADVQKYFDEHKDDFEVGEKARVEVVAIDFVASGADRDAARFTAGRILEYLSDGEEFATLAKTYSEAPTSYVEGKTGFINESMREKVLVDALAGMEVGDVSQPIEAEQGYYVVKLLETRTTDEGTPEFSAQEILVKPLLSRQTSDSLYALAEQVRERATSDGLETAAGEHGLELIKPDPFSQGGLVGQFGFASELNDFAFSAAVGTLSGVLRDDGRVYVAILEEKIPAGTRPLEEVADQIRADLVAQRKKDVSYLSAKGFHTGSRRPDIDFASTAKEYNVEIKRPEPFKALDDLDGFGPMSPVAESAMLVQPGDVAPPVEAGGSWVVVKVLSRSEFDADDYRARFESIRRTLLSAKVQQYVAYWYEKIKDDSEIEDFRRAPVSS